MDSINALAYSVLFPPMFQFKQFTIQQDRTPMKVGTDGVLLGAWADLDGAKTILDIGTGTGLIALMGAQRNHAALVHAIEIEPQACQQAQENIQNSPWADRVQLFPSALQSYFPEIFYDSIVCNPPFFIHSTKTPDPGRTLARHNDSLPLPDLVQNVRRLLCPEGNFCVILPVKEAQELITLAQTCHLFPAQITRVIPNPGKPPKRLLVKFIFSPCPIAEDELIIEFSRHCYSDKYKTLTQAFYLGF